MTVKWSYTFDSSYAVATVSPCTSIWWTTQLLHLRWVCFYPADPALSPWIWRRLVQHFATPTLWTVIERASKEGWSTVSNTISGTTTLSPHASVYPLHDLVRKLLSFTCPVYIHDNGSTTQSVFQVLMDDINVGYERLAELQVFFYKKIPF
jgi:hypothetical protein